MNRFLSGDHGPAFVGYDGPTFRQKVATQFAFGLGVGCAVYVLMVLFG